MDNTNTFNLFRTGAIAIASISFLAGCSESPEQVSSPVRPVKLFDVIDRQSQSLREFPARVEASEEASISFRIPGELIEFPVSSAGCN